MVRSFEDSPWLRRAYAISRHWEYCFEPVTTRITGLTNLVGELKPVVRYGDSQLDSLCNFVYQTLIAYESLVGVGRVSIDLPARVSEAARKMRRSYATLLVDLALLVLAGAVPQESNRDYGSRTAQ